MRLFRSFIVLAILGIVPFSLTGCGGSNDGSPSPTASPSSTIRVNSRLVGDWTGGWGVDNGGGGGPATLSVKENGAYTLYLENVKNDKDESQNVTFSGTMSESGYFAQPIPGTANDSISGAYVSTLDDNNTRKWLLTYTRKLVQGGTTFDNSTGVLASSGSLNLTRKN